jgi:starch phosphorylase
MPQGWVQTMKEAIISLAPVFSTRRMLKDYCAELYIPAIREATGSEPALTSGR